MNFRMNSHAQAGQDLFAVAMTEGMRNGFYLDIGCYHPTSINNTWLLESEFGWTGILVDLLPDCKTRKGFFQCDATNPTPELHAAYDQMPDVVDLLSLDVDEATLATFNTLPWETKRFRVACVEHDAYFRGSDWRDIIRRRMLVMGYVLVCADVCIRFPDPTGSPSPFEDWYADPQLVKTELISKFTCSGKEWTEIVKELNV